jgi:hypothetical protein
MDRMTSEDFVQFRLDCIPDVDQLAEEVADKMMDIFTNHLGENVTSLDVEILGQMLCWEMMSNIDSYFMDRVFELSDELNEETEDEDYEDVDGESDVTEV